MTVAFDGTPGGRTAALALVPEARPLGLARAERVIEAVAAGEAERGVAPVEDSRDGSRAEVLDLLLATDALRIAGERWEAEGERATRFVLLAPEGTAPDGPATKTTLVLTPKPEVPNALFRSLTAFVGRRLAVYNVTPRPRPGQPGAYRYVVDVEGDAAAEPLASALTDLAALNDAVRVLGSYPEAVL